MYTKYIKFRQIGFYHPKLYNLLLQKVNSINNFKRFCIEAKDFLKENLYFLMKFEIYNGNLHLQDLWKNSKRLPWNSSFLEYQKVFDIPARNIWVTSGISWLWPADILLKNVNAQCFDLNVTVFEDLQSDLLISMYFLDTLCGIKIFIKETGICHCYIKVLVWLV